MWTVRRGIAMGVVAVAVVIGTAVAWYLARTLGPTQGCAVTGATSAASSTPADFTLTVEQADNAATIAGVGIRLGMPDHAVSVALATAMQESRLRNLPNGDRDSAGLFQQRPSQGWGTHAQVVDPVHAATAFYERLRTEPNWRQLSVTEAAQLVQRSATPDAYAQWEPEARVAASALTGERAAALRCHDLTIAPPSAALAPIAVAELGTAKLSGAHDQTHGWAISSWLVAHASRLGADRVTFNGSTWTAKSGTWSHTGSADGMLTLHQVSGAATQG
ncbi:MAG: hypothetical protein QOE54_1023 [Streptosporangiaceae bacterium]|nr:hypothetical protein [Streptosporangiaceae bacterium]